MTTTDELCYQWLTQPAAAALALLWVSEGLFQRLLHREPPDAQSLLPWRDAKGQVVDQVLCWGQSAGVVVSLHGGHATRALAQAELDRAGACQKPVSDLWETKDRLSQLVYQALPLVHGRLGAELLLACAAQGRDAMAITEKLPAEGFSVLREAWLAAHHLFHPPRVQLWGPVNAGKSSLLNALCGKALAATGPEPGLTRDVIEGQLEHQGFVMRVFDAPGTGHGGGELDRAAAELADHWRASADLVLELVPPGAEPTGAGDLHLFSRSDQDPAGREPGVCMNDQASLMRIKDRLVDHFIGPLQKLEPRLRLAWPPELLALLESGDPEFVKRARTLIGDRA